MSSSCVFDLKKISPKILDRTVYIILQYASALLKVPRQARYTANRKITTHNTINFHNSTLQHYTCYKGRYKYHERMSQLHKTFYCNCLRYELRNNNSALLVI
jgi:hypothetical protein